MEQIYLHAERVGAHIPSSLELSRAFWPTLRVWRFHARTRPPAEDGCVFRATEHCRTDGSPILRDFREIDSGVNNRQLKEILAGKRYTLSAFSTSDEKQGYGITAVALDSEEGLASVVLIGRQGQYSLVDNGDSSDSVEIIKRPSMK